MIKQLPNQLSNCFSGGTMVVVADGFRSTLLLTGEGVPQGSFSGPLLLTLYINDIVPTPFSIIMQMTQTCVWSCTSAVCLWCISAVARLEPCKDCAAVVEVSWDKWQYGDLPLYRTSIHPYSITAYLVLRVAGLLVLNFPKYTNWIDSYKYLGIWLDSKLTRGIPDEKAERENWFPVQKQVMFFFLSSNFCSRKITVFFGWWMDVVQSLDAVFHTGLF